MAFVVVRFDIREWKAGAGFHHVRLARPWTGKSHLRNSKQCPAGSELSVIVWYKLGTGSCGRGQTGQSCPEPLGN
jgi:hypothetical protein